MKKTILDLFIGFLASCITMLGGYFVTFYFMEGIFGLIGYFIIFPAIHKWEERINNLFNIQK
jgi:hypothetical protein